MNIAKCFGRFGRAATGIGLAVVFGVACGGDQGGDVAAGSADAMDAAPEAEAAPSGPPAQPAAAVLRTGAGEEVGRATFTQEGNEVVITVDARNVEGGEHGVHIHEVGVCEGPDFTSAGGHFNPTNRQHGLDNPNGPHAGDLPNAHVDPDDGIVREVYRTDRVTLRPDQPNSLLDADGSALIIHAGADDNVTDPSGDSGARIICGVIEPA